MILVAAMILDAIFGEPGALWRRAPHPAALMGRAVSALDGALNKGEGRRLKGALAALILAGGGAGIGALIAALPFGPLWEALAAAILLAQKSLVDHVSDVAGGLDRSLDEGREAVSRIVGRDVQALDRSGVARGAIESAAENFSDGVVAPVFWFLLLGLPGIVLYKAANTADSMIGHRTPRHEEFGWASARLDDLLNLAPARLSAFILSLAGGGLAGWRAALRDASRHRSPNAGWPEAATAAALGVALSGPRAYHGVMGDQPWVFPEGRRALGSADIRAAVALLWKGWAILLAAALGWAAFF